MKGDFTSNSLQKDCSLTSPHRGGQKLSRGKRKSRKAIATSLDQAEVKEHNLIPNTTRENLPKVRIKDTKDRALPGNSLQKRDSKVESENRRGTSPPYFRSSPEVNKKVCTD